MKVIFEDIQDVYTFSKGIEYYDGEIDVKQGRHVANARSFLGMCSLDLNNPIDITINTDNKENESNFYKYLKKWEIKDGCSKVY